MKDQLRQAAQQALEALREFGYHGSSPRWERTANALQAALAQPKQEPTCPKCKAGVLYECVACSSNNYPPKPEQEPSQWREMVVVSLVREGIDKHRARELADHFAAQRPWQGLTDEDWEKVANRKNTVLDTFEQGAAWAAYKLERRNT